MSEHQQETSVFRPFSVLCVNPFCERAISISISLQSLGSEPVEKTNITKTRWFSNNKERGITSSHQYRNRFENSQGN